MKKFRAEIGTRALAAIAGAFLLILFPAGAGAQEKLISTPADSYAIAPGGVDMRTGIYVYNNTDLSVGGLDLTRITHTGIPGHANPFGNFGHNWDILITEKRVHLNGNDYQHQHGSDYRMNIHFGGRQATFDSYQSATGFSQPAHAAYAKLSFTGSKPGAAVYTYEQSDGTVLLFNAMGSGNCADSYRCAYVSKIIQPDGTVLTFEYEAGPHLRSITSSRGFALLLETNGALIGKACILNLAVVAKPPDNVCPSTAQATASYTYTSHAGTRLASFTDPAGKVWGFTYSGAPSQVSMGFVKPDQSSAWLTNQMSTSFFNDEDYPYETIGAQIFADGQQYAYGFSPAFGDTTPAVVGGSFTNALGHRTWLEYDFPYYPGKGPGDQCQQFPCSNDAPIDEGNPTGSYVRQQTSGPVRIIDPLDRTTVLEHCDPVAMAGLTTPPFSNKCYVGQLYSFTDPGGVQTHLKYDGFGNVIEARRRAKPVNGQPSSEPDIVTRATYSCAGLNLKICAKPATMTDARGNVTSFTYSPDHGGLLTRTGPAVQTRQPGGGFALVSPQTRYSYALRDAWTPNGVGGYAQIWVLTQESFCRVGAPASGGGCALANDEVVTSYDYGPTPGPNLLLLRGKVVTADGVSLRTCFGYDDSGRKVSETSPRANLASCPGTTPTSGSAFTGVSRYDAVGRVTGTIAPDPDGGGPLLFAAVRNTYDGAGRLTRVEKGKLAAWQGAAVAPASWADFATHQTLDTVYDVLDRKVSESVSGGGVRASLTQYEYDLAGRLKCTKVRMNPAVFASAPTTNCALGTPGTPGGPNDFGPDRITFNTYDAAGQLLKVTEGYGTSIAADVRTNSYTLNGKIETLTDAENNRTTYEYDGQDRMVKARFPVLARGANVSSATDIEQYGYDPNGNRTSFIKRDGSLLNYSFDALNRMTVKVVPPRETPGPQELTPAQTRDVYYAYDLRNLETEARFDSHDGEGVGNAYDGFGRLRSTTTAMAGTSRTITHSQYDANGNRRELTWPDNVKMSFSHDGLDRMTGVFEGALGSTVSLAGIAYNDRGQRASMSRRYGDSTAYDYDDVGRLKSLTESFPGTNGNTASAFTYLPSNQVRTIGRSNDAYAWRGHVNVNRAYTANGLNQYSNAADVGFLYDANGNLIQSGATAPTPATNYIYDIENRLVRATGAVNATLVYDPLGRLFQVSGGSAGPTQFLYDGDELVAEYDAVTASIVHRYVHGAGVDDPLVWYEGADLTKPRFLHTDHQGSIAGIAGADGALLAINSYDEYGIPAETNLGRFQYTGQAWIPELKMYHYKARIYSPTLGRFLQTDPIGYEDQINLYAYVKNDPVNSVDPDGTCSNPSQSRVCQQQHRLMENARRTGVREAWRQERILVAHGGGTRAWTPAQRNELIRTGSVKGMVGHHINTVNGNDIAMARNPNNVRFVTHAEHVMIHRLAGGCRTPICGKPLLSRAVTGAPVRSGFGARVSGTGSRAMSIGGILTMFTGMLSGRIRTDATIGDALMNMIGEEGPTDIMERDIRACGAPGCV